MGVTNFTSIAAPGAIKWAEGSLADADTGGGIMSVANPEGVDLLVDAVIIDTTTKSTGACTVDIGVAANGTTSSDTLLDGVDVGTAIGTFDNMADAGTNGEGMVKLPAGRYITASTATGNAAGLVGSYYFRYRKA